MNFSFGSGLVVRLSKLVSGFFVFSQFSFLLLFLVPVEHRSFEVIINNYVSFIDLLICLLYTVRYESNCGLWKNTDDMLYLVVCHLQRSLKMCVQAIALCASARTTSTTLVDSWRV